MTTSSINLKVIMNSNGLKCLKINKLGYGSFSIQTNGNLPRIHNLCDTGNIKNPAAYSVALAEISDYVFKHGTVAQQSLIKGK